LRFDVTLWRLELRQLLTGRAWFGLTLILSVLVGSTFAQAVGIFSEGSRSALASPDLAQGLNPYDGILVPTFGSAYLVATLLLPFVAIRQIGQDRESGALKLLLGLGCSPLRIVLRKFLVLALAWAVFLLVPLSAALLWMRLGGHVHGPAFAGLFLGHFCYGLVVIALALLAGSLGRSAATASLLVLAATLGSWVLDFGGAAGGGWLSRLAPLSLTQALRPLERGLLPLGHLLTWPALVMVALALAACWLHPGRPIVRKGISSLSGVALVLLVFLGAARIQHSWDLTEDRRHSFPIAVERALAGIPGHLEIEVRLDAEDPRWMDLDRGILHRLQRVVPHLRVVRTIATAAFGRTGPSSDDRYGEVIYRYQGREDMSRSTSSEEILPLIYTLTETPPPAEGPEIAYPGYPRVLASPPGMLWFRLFLPLLALALWAWQRIYNPKPI
jgi:hypothetical protein